VSASAMSKALRHVLGPGLLLLGACDPFPRVNPVDPGAVGYAPALDAGASRDGAATDGPLTTHDGSQDVAPTGPAELVWVSDTITDARDASPRNNGNGRAEPGETLRMNVTLRNVGGAVARGVTTTLVATGDCATAETTTRGSLSYGAVEPGATAANNAGFGEQFVLTLSPTCAPGSSVDLTLQARDASGASWDLSFRLPIVTSDAAVGYVSNTITDARDASPRNNGNGRAEPGETLRMNVTLRNAGGSAARGVTTTLVAMGDCATAETTTRGALNFGSIDPGATATNNAGFGEQFVLTLSPTCAPRSSVDLTLQARDASGAAWNLPFQLPIVASDTAVTYVSNVITDATGASPRNNGNGRAEPGETLRMNVTLRNAGGSTARGVSATLLATGACATVQTTTRGALNFGSIEPGATATNNAGFGEQFEVTLSPTACMSGTPESLTVQVRDASGASWNLPFQLPIVASDAAISYVSNTITDPSSLSGRNNGNGRAEPGETLRMNVTLRNAGGSTARGVSATLLATGACATVQTTTRGALNFGSIEPGATATNNAGFGEQFEVTLSPTACVSGSSLGLTVQARDASGSSWPLPFSLRIE